MTPAEIALWGQLRRKCLGYKFRRQYGVGVYILDFYCPQLKFCIEVDGDIHALPDVKLKDERRGIFLNNCGITVKRYWNSEIFEDLDSVVEEIYGLCHDLTVRKNRLHTLPQVSTSKIRGRIRGN